MCRRKKRSYFDSKLLNLDLKDAKSTWKNLKELFTIGKERSGSTCKANEKDLFWHFKNLNSINTSDIIDTDTESEMISSQGTLDFPITDQEVDEVISVLKKRKAPGPDNIPNEFLITGKNALKGHLQALFNKILRTGTYPTLWNVGYIVPIFKKEDPTKAENYLGITLLSAIRKVFTAILNKRFYNYKWSN